MQNYSLKCKHWAHTHTYIYTPHTNTLYERNAGFRTTDGACVEMFSNIHTLKFPVERVCECIRTNERYIVQNVLRAMGSGVKILNAYFKMSSGSRGRRMGTTGCVYEGISIMYIEPGDPSSSRAHECFSTHPD